MKKHSITRLDFLKRIAVLLLATLAWNFKDLLRKVSRDISSKGRGPATKEARYWRADHLAG